VRFVAFLRGVNVGGNSKIAMSEIVTCLENIGLRNVSTYINSGNILFTSDGADLKHLTLQIEEALVDVSGFHIPVLLRTKDQIDNLIRQINSDWHNNAEEKTDIMFLWNEVDTPDIIDQITKKTRARRFVLRQWRFSMAHLSKQRDKKSRNIDRRYSFIQANDYTQYQYCQKNSEFALDLESKTSHSFANPKVIKKIVVYK
jgi:uncharacterized protein (DUF1697 family)